MIYFDALTESDCEQIRVWRNADISAARTPFLLTADMQRDFYFDEVSNRQSPHRYWAISGYPKIEITSLADEERQYMELSTLPPRRESLLGIAGLTNIEWENGRAEIALMIAPAERGKGYGNEAFELIKLWGFSRMRLYTIYACVYGNNPALVAWWEQQGPDEQTSYPGGKFWGNETHRTYHYTWVNK